ncbi:MAG: hypothetical protein MUP55_00540 [Candidatus Aenigmarchaeota archaeon]|nr:hypothetical protein [Candidatus Aenigmarchaeota archaeon]
MPEEEFVRSARLRPRVDMEILQRQMAQLQGRQRPPEPEPEPEPTKVQQPPRYDPIFKNMDVVIKDMYQFVPNVSSELVYRSELDKDMKLYGFFMFFGAICILVSIAYSLY